MAGICLDHFIEAQNANFKTALNELTAGKKTSHWIWYIFPQIAELGYSERSKRYGIKTRKEAKAFIAHPMLSANYSSCLDALLLHTGTPIMTIMGGIDASKLNSSLTLFKGVSDNPALQQKISNTLSRFFDGSECDKTTAFLSTQSTLGFKLGFRPRSNAS
jgi:uncharacterized protein (DUF1810 family)